MRGLASLHSALYLESFFSSSAKWCQHPLIEKKECVWKCVFGGVVFPRRQTSAQFSSSFACLQFNPDTCEQTSSVHILAGIFPWHISRANCVCIHYRSLTSFCFDSCRLNSLILPSVESCAVMLPLWSKKQLTFCV